MKRYKRRVPRKRSASAIRIRRTSGREGVQIVRLFDYSPLGIAIETLEPRPYKSGEEIHVYVSDKEPEKFVRGVVRHISQRLNDEGLVIYGVGIEFLF